MKRSNSPFPGFIPNSAKPPPTTKTIRSSSLNMPNSRGKTPVRITQDNDQEEKNDPKRPPYDKSSKKRKIETNITGIPIPKIAFPPPPPNPINPPPNPIKHQPDCSDELGNVTFSAGQFNTNNNQFSQNIPEYNRTKNPFQNPSTQKVQKQENLPKQYHSESFQNHTSYQNASTSEKAANMQNFNQFQIPPDWGKKEENPFKGNNKKNDEKKKEDEKIPFPKRYDPSSGNFDHQQKNESTQPKFDSSTYPLSLFCQSDFEYKISQKEFQKLKSLKTIFDNLPSMSDFHVSKKIPLKKLQKSKQFLVPIIRAYKFIYFRMKELKQNVSLVKKKDKELEEKNDTLKKMGMEKLLMLKRHHEKQIKIKNILFESEKIITTINYQVNLFKEVIRENEQRKIYHYVDPDQGVVILGNFLKNRWQQIEHTLENLLIVQNENDKESVNIAEILEMEVNEIYKICSNLSDLQHRIGIIRKKVGQSQEEKLSALLHQKTMSELYKEWETYDILKQTDVFLTERKVQKKKEF